MMLDARLLSAPLMDHRRLDLEAAARLTYVLEQSFRYDYEAPVAALRQRLVVVPKPRHGSQYRRAHQLSVTGADASRRVRRDSRGNVIAWLHADHVARSVEFRIAAVLERVAGRERVSLPAGALDSPDLLRPTALTAADERLRDLGAGLAASSDTPLERAARICSLVHAAMSYCDGATSVATSAAQALAGGRGVCQDYAHVMLALCRLTGLPARYVSGHLLGQGGTHAWVEVVVPSRHEAVACAFDPCNGGRAGNGYVTIATGRDYRDVAPTSGTYLGASQGRLTTGRRVGVLAAT
jgi:transglutaminase-like putative cysteine protease